MLSLSTSNCCYKQPQMMSINRSAVQKLKSKSNVQPNNSCVPAFLKVLQSRVNIFSKFRIEVQKNSAQHELMFEWMFLLQTSGCIAEEPLKPFGHIDCSSLQTVDSPD